MDGERVRSESFTIVPASCHKIETPWEPTQGHGAGSDSRPKESSSRIAAAAIRLSELLQRLPPDDANRHFVAMFLRTTDAVKTPEGFEGWVVLSPLQKRSGQGRGRSARQCVRSAVVSGLSLSELEPEIDRGSQGRNGTSIILAHVPVDLLTFGRGRAERRVLEPEVPVGSKDDRVREVQRLERAHVCVD
jgi:hypothetical protein